jgi:riboflavin kinase/FMN adenylyltransferase
MASRSGVSHYHRDMELRLAGSVLTVGAFDGVHRGHQALLRRTVSAAGKLGLPSVVYTFDTPPKVHFGRANAVISLAERVARIAWFGVDHVIVARFDNAYAARPASGFVDELAMLNPTMILVGEDFRFGSCQRGDVALLRRHFDTRTLAPVRCSAGEIVSSTRIRNLRRSGHSLAAAALEGWQDLLMPSLPYGLVPVPVGRIHP